MIDQYITGGFFLIIATVMLVSAVDKILSPNFPKIKANRGWLLPIASLVFGIFIFWIYALAEEMPVNIFQVIFNGVNIGSFSTALYKIVREAVIKRIGQNIASMNFGDTHHDNDDE